MLTRVSDVLAIALAGAVLCGTPSTARARDPQVIVTRPCGFAWREAFVGAAAAGTVVALAAGAAELRHRPSQPKERS
jgi:hypothetical protein